MSLAPGTRLGPYEIVAPLGAGGMGEVYRARDTRLGRDVAVKVLPQHLASAPEVRARFEREAKTISSLNHPHICTLHDVGREGEIDFLVMELVEGETLADRLAKGALPTAQMLTLGIEIADALDKAHRAGIVHRDLKPGNVMLTKSGAKLMDFGLARPGALGPAGGDFTQSPTVSRPLTAEGAIVGTFQYMSPEQLEGREADTRTDLWALGCVLYEMGTGKRAFEGKSQASLISAIMKDEPAPMSTLQPMSPPALERLVRACLTKDPDERIQSAHDVRIQLRWIADGGSEGATLGSRAAGGALDAATARTDARRSRWRRPAALAIALLSLVTLLLAGALIGRRATPPAVVRACVPPPQGAVFHLMGVHPGPPAVSLDGKALAFVARAARVEPSLWVRSLDSENARELPGTEGAGYPFWSPDGRSIGFFAAGKLKKIDVAGGPPITLCDASVGKGGTWGEDGFILFAPGNLDPIHRVSAAGGESQAVTRIDSTRGENSHRFPSLLPDGRSFLYFARSGVERGGPVGGAVMAATIDGKKNALVMHGESQGLYASGHLLFTRDRVLMAQRFDSRALTLTGEAFPVAAAVHLITGACFGVFSVSEGGVLAYLNPTEEDMTHLLLFDRTGSVVDSLGRAAFVNAPRVSPDGRTCVIGEADPKTGLPDLWLYDIARRTRTRFTFEPANKTGPQWSPDGQRIVYGSASTGLLRVKPVSGSIVEDTLLAWSQPIWPLDWSPDGRSLLCGTQNSRTRLDVLILSPAEEGEPRPILDASFNEYEAEFSRNGRWIAYGANESGVQNVFVMPFPGSTRKWQVSVEGGRRPRWSHDGRELFYLGTEGRIMSVEVETQTSDFMASRPTPLFDLGVDADYDVMPDGNRFLVTCPLESAQQPSLTLVLNWTAALAKR